MKWRVWGVAAAGLLLLSRPGFGAATDLDDAQIRDLVAGNTISVVTKSLAPAEGYMDPDGAIRGQRNGADFTGSWAIKDNRLCFDLPGNDFDICRTVAKDGDEVLMFDESGSPAGRLTVEAGNPNGW